MCGIAGIIGNFERVDVSDILRMTTVMKHRGPDDEGFVCINSKTREGHELYSARSAVRRGVPIEEFSAHADVVFGHRRLSIIDTSTAGHQPMSYENGMLWIVYNGEIYNYKELREEMKTRGCEFTTGTDTEVVLAAYREWGLNCVKRFNGDWAFAIYDVRKNIVFMSRDRFAIKPFYYVYRPFDRFFAFASEIKALHLLSEVEKGLNKEKCFEFLVFSLLDHAGNTLYNSVRQIEPGHSMTLDMDGFRLKTVRHYELKCDYSTEGYSQKKALAYAGDVCDLLKDSVRLRLRADVPIGTCLSGGLDSSSIAVLINGLLLQEGVAAEQVGERQKTFTASFRGEPLDETEYAKIIAGHIVSEGHFVMPTDEGLRDEIDSLLYHHEEPFGGPSIYVQWKVMEEAAKHVKVVLDGQGGDEVFGGYANYRSAYIAQLCTRGELVRAAAEILGTFRMCGSVRKMLVDLKAYPIFMLPKGMKALLYLNKKAKAMKRAFERLGTDAKSIPIRFINSFVPDLNRVLTAYMMEYSLPHLLKYEDRNSMAFSIESRTPFTDYRLVDYVFSLPASYKYRNGWSKWLLRLAMRDLLPGSVLWRRDKIGFAASRKMNAGFGRERIFDLWYERQGL